MSIAVIPSSQRRRRFGSWPARLAGLTWPTRLCVALLALVALGAVLAPWIEPYDPTSGDLSSTLAGPGGGHWLGTDGGGHDTFSQLLAGGRTSLLGPLGVVLFSTVAGVLVGLACAWRGGWVDALIGRVLDVLFAFPSLLLAILAVALFGKGLGAPVVAMAIAYMPYTARLVRGLTAQEKTRPYIAAYRVQGHAATFIALRRLLPAIAPTVLAQSTVNFGYALLDLAALSFLGLGVQPPTPDWGAMINQSQAAVLEGQPLSAVLPALLVVIVVVAVTVVGEHFADRLTKREA
ncbi:peptide/nickel transport system permease protein [Catenulispora sp. MAP12-49]|uniref:ABC transporter permease n=1 Tax=Catenulispora sp. MAP12-49 TaxID=3156302 RepID=UPI003514CEF4